MYKSNVWVTESKKTITTLKIKLGNLVKIVRGEQFEIFWKIFQPTNKTKVLDVGVASEEDIEGTNYFEKKYKFSKMLTLVTIEDSDKLRKKYPLSRVVGVKPNKPLPFKDNEFDVVVSWATLEHVGGYGEQERFINELSRIGKHIFVTTPYRGCVYEPHSGFLFLHWLSLNVFRRICSITNNKFWAKEKNLNPLYVKDINRMNLNKKVRIILFKMFGIIPSHLIITSKK